MRLRRPAPELRDGWTAPDTMLGDRPLPAVHRKGVEMLTGMRLTAAAVIGGVTLVLVVGEVTRGHGVGWPRISFDGSD
jgi:hypothetical protein